MAGQVSFCTVSTTHQIIVEKERLQNSIVFVAYEVLRNTLYLISCSYCLSFNDLFMTRSFVWSNMVMVNDELVMILNEVGCFKVICQIFPLRAEENFGQDIRPPGRELNPGSLRFRGVLSTQPRHSIYPKSTFLVRKNG